jgi:TPR repeat protein
MAARLLFSHAAGSGIGVAALKLGDTYSPAVLAELHLSGIKADPAEAEAWYRKAQALGEAQAEERLKKLEDYRPAVSSTR